MVHSHRMFTKHWRKVHIPTMVSVCSRACLWSLPQKLLLYVLTCHEQVPCVCFLLFLRFSVFGFDSLVILYSVVGLFEFTLLGVSQMILLMYYIKFNKLLAIIFFKYSLCLFLSLFFLRFPRCICYSI